MASSPLNLRYPSAVARSVIVRPEGQRAFDELGQLWADKKRADRLFQFHREGFPDLESADPAVRASEGKYLLALLAQSLADESNGRIPWKASAWRSSDDFGPREFRRDLAQPLSFRVTAPEVFDAAVWLIDHDPEIDNQLFGVETLCHIHLPEQIPIFRRLLAAPHPNEAVLLDILHEITRRKLTDLAPEVRRLAVHYRRAVRIAACNAAIALGAKELPVYCPEDAFTPWLDVQMKAIVARIEAPIPPSASWKNFEVTRPPWQPGEKPSIESFAGWLVGEDDKSVDVVSLAGTRLRLEKKSVKIAPSTLQETARAMLEARRQPDDGRSEPRFAYWRAKPYGCRMIDDAAQEAIVAAWLYQRGDRKTAAALLFPQLEYSLDDRLWSNKIRNSLGDLYQGEMALAFAEDRDYRHALHFAQHLAKPAFDGYWLQDTAKDLTEQLPRRGDDYKKFCLPRPDQWAKLKITLSRPAQIEYLVRRLPLLHGRR